MTSPRSLRIVERNLYVLLKLDLRIYRTVEKRVKFISSFHMKTLLLSAGSFYYNRILFFIWSTTQDFNKTAAEANNIAFHHLRKFKSVKNSLWRFWNLALFCLTDKHIFIYEQNQAYNAKINRHYSLTRSYI